ncbi:MAG: hypothetical protein WKF55_03265 [Gemmatimonadaceae bacterium]
MAYKVPGSNMKRIVWRAATAVALRFVAIVRNTYLAAACFGVAAILTVGCSEASGPAETAKTRTIRVDFATTGVAADLDQDGYTVSIDGGEGRAASGNIPVLFPNVSPGEHLVQLDGLAPNCSVDGTNPRAVSVTGGDPTAPIIVSFSITCMPPTGSIRISTVTSGAYPDSDGYRVIVPYVPPIKLPANGTETIAGVRVGQHEVFISDVSANCTVDQPNPRVTVAKGQTADVTFTIRCVAEGSLQVTTTTTGVELDSNGYGIEIRRQNPNVSRSMSFPANGTVTIGRLLPGDYLLTLYDVVPNCDPVMPNPRAVTVGAGSPTSIVVDVRCSAPAQLAFVKVVTGNNREIWLINSNGTGERQLTFEPSSEVDPAWSPDGNRIAFASDRDGNREVYVMNADGSAQVRLTSSAMGDYHPAWSPDGRRIAFVSERNGNAEIYVMNADGTNPLRLTSDSATDDDPAWSPDGRRIAFRSGRTGGGDIYVMNADGSEQSRLTTNTVPDAHPSWSPDGTRIAFSGGVSSTSRDIFVINADGSGSTRLMLQYLEPEDPMWSPDGRKIAITEYDYYDDVARIRIVTVNGIAHSATIPPVITSVSQPAWRP